MNTNSLVSLNSSSSSSKTTSSCIPKSFQPVVKKKKSLSSFSSPPTFVSSPSNSTLSSTHQTTTTSTTPSKRKKKTNLPSFTTRKHISTQLLKKSNYVYQLNQQRNQQIQSEKRKAKLFLTESKGYLEAEGIERTYKFTQEEIKEHLDLVNRAKIFDLKLNTFGPYSIDYTRNGRYLLLGGKKGHISNFDWKTGQLFSEFYVNETVRDVSWLHNETLFALAQKEYVYIYDRMGTELHVLRKHHRVQKLQFLPYHFLLATIGDSGILRYQDVSTGQLMYEQSTHRGTTQVMTYNPTNAILHCGHAKGTVTLWSPNVNKLLVEILCHSRGPILSCSVHPSQPLMLTSGLEGVKVWDLRYHYQSLITYRLPLPVSQLAVSQQGLWACDQGNRVQVYPSLIMQSNDPSSCLLRERTSLTSSFPSSHWISRFHCAPFFGPYMQHRIASSSSSFVHDLQFVPFDDGLGVGSSFGFSSLVIPGSGEPNFDALEVNPYETKKQRREHEVHQLLQKLPIDTIHLDPMFMGQCVPHYFESNFTGQGMHAPSSSSSSSSTLMKSTRPKNSKLVVRDSNKTHPTLLFESLPTDPSVLNTPLNTPTQPKMKKVKKQKQKHRHLDSLKKKSTSLNEQENETYSIEIR